MKAKLIKPLEEENSRSNLPWMLSRKLYLVARNSTQHLTLVELPGNEIKCIFKASVNLWLVPKPV